jgi:hypothetical protein
MSMVCQAHYIYVGPVNWYGGQFNGGCVTFMVYDLASPLFT